MLGHTVQTHLAVTDHYFDLTKLKETAIEYRSFIHPDIKLTPEIRTWMKNYLGDMDRIGYIRGTMKRGWTTIEGDPWSDNPPRLLIRAEDNVAMLFKLTWL